MSSKKSNKAKATEETVVETPVVETTEETTAETTVEPPVEGETVEETPATEETPVTEENPVTEEVPVTEETVVETTEETTVETPVTEDKPVDEATKVTSTTMSAPRSVNDKYDTDLGDEDEKPSTDPETEEEEVEDEKETTKEITDRAVMNKYLQKVYNVKFSFSQASKRFAVNRTMTLLAMYDMFVKNRVAFVGLKSQDDYKEIHDFMTKYTVIYKYMTVSAAAKEQFLTKLRVATDYVVMSSK